MKQEKKLVVGYVCDSNPYTDKAAWSGLNYKIRESIENAGCDVVWIKCRPNGKISKLCKIWNEKIHGKATMYEHTRLYFRLRAMSINRQLLDKCDVLFFSRGAQVMNFLKTDKPAIYYSDSTFQLMCGYYWPSVSKWQYKTGNSLETGGIVKSRINIRASQWAADSVAKDYGQDPSHTYIMRFGANLDDQDIKPIVPYSGKGRLNILFSGVDWKRKGAETAIHTVEKLNAAGTDARLYMVGIAAIPEKFKNHPYVENVGYLNKSNPVSYRKYIETLEKCHIFILPTRAECAGIVFGECSAFGIPIYTYDTGGIGDYVSNGVNGYRLPMTAGPEEFAAQIRGTLDPQTQAVLHKGCLEIYRERLNWHVWSEDFKAMIEQELRPLLTQ